MKSVGLLGRVSGSYERLVRREESCGTFSREPSRKRLHRAIGVTIDKENLSFSFSPTLSLEIGAPHEETEKTHRDSRGRFLECITRIGETAAPEMVAVESSVHTAAAAVCLPANRISSRLYLLITWPLWSTRLVKRKTRA